MADQVNSRNSLPIPDESQPTASKKHAVPRKPTSHSPENPVSPARDQTYVIHIPRDQVIRVPPSENARRMEQYTRRKNRRSRCGCYLCCLISLILIIGIATGGIIIYLMHRLKAPHYTVDRISIHGMNLASTESQAISPEFEIALRAKNPNDIFGIYYQKDNSVEVFYKELRLGDGALPAFYQPSNNVTVFQTTLNGSDIGLTSTDAKALVDDAQNKRSVPLTLKLKGRVKVKVCSVKTWKITVKVDCHITVDNLTAQAKLVSRNCHDDVNLWCLGLFYLNISFAMWLKFSEY